MKISSRDSIEPISRQGQRDVKPIVKPQSKNKEVYRKDVLAEALKNLWKDEK